MTTSTINRFIRLFADAFAALGVAVPMGAVERLAMAVHCDMEHGLRVYHTSPHVLELCAGMKPLQVLAALYHDIVYYQLDGGFPSHADQLLRRVAYVSPEQVSLRRFDPADADLQLCAGVFGFTGDKVLSVYGGMNEFLSAVVAVRTLSPYLQREQLLAVVACIEATIPFRGYDQMGRTMAESLALRVRATADAQGLQVDAKAVDLIVQDAVVLANSDVDSFAAADPAQFLSGTWRLIEESNAPLTKAGVYSAREYRKALQRMETFLATLNAECVFHDYLGVPDAGEMQRLTERGRANLHFAVDYLGAKLASISVIEALALETGGNAPVSMFLGDVHVMAGDQPDRIEDFLPLPAPRTDLDLHLLEVLEKGGLLDSSNDATASPLTAYCYRQIGPAGMRAVLEAARQMFAGTLGPADFLRGPAAGLAGTMAEACMRIALSRSEKLHALRASLTS